MNTTIEVNRLHIYARHGVMEQEHTVGNDFEVSVHLQYPVDPAADSILATANYAEIIQTAKSVMDRPVALIENVAWQLQKELTRRWPMSTGGMVRIAKLHPPVANIQLESAAVTIRW